MFLLVVLRGLKNIVSNVGKLSLSINALIKNLELLTGVVFYGISTVIFIVSLRGGELSVLYPIAASSYIWVVVFSIKFLGERMDKSKWLGIGLIVAGVSLIGLGAV